MKKKVRGMKRKVKKMIQRIEENTKKFPSKFVHDYCDLHLPVVQDFINSQTPEKVRRNCI